MIGFLQFTGFSLITAATGLFFGKAPERWKSLARLAAGSGVTLFFALLLLGLAWLYPDWCWSGGVDFMRKWGGNFALMDDALMPPPALFSALIVGVTGAFLYLAAFNCRRTAERFGVACGGTVLAGVVLFWGFPWGLNGICVFDRLFFAYSWEDRYFQGLIGGVVFMAALLAGWTVWTFRSRKRGWKVLFLRIGVCAGAFLICWLLAFAAAFSYGYRQVARAEKAGVTPWYFEAKLPPELQTEFDKQWWVGEERSDFELPYESIGWWRGKEKEMVPEEKRAYTLKWFDSPEYRAYCAQQEALLRKMTAKKYYLAQLNLVRHYARIRCGRAALFYETGQPEKILPELLTLTMLYDEILHESPSGSAELTLAAVRGLEYRAAVQLGPDDPRYAPVYRAMLERAKATRVRVPDGAGFPLYYLDRALHFRVEGGSTRFLGRYVEFIGSPIQVAVFAAGVSEAFADRERLAGLEQAEVLKVLPEEAKGFRHQPRGMARSSLRTLVLGRVGLALKLYRVEKGSYPDQLDKLVPEYLEKIPPCPYTGEPLRYTSDGKNFTLSLCQHEKVHFINSVPKY